MSTLILLIDGYNLLKSIYHTKAQHKLSKQRNELITQLGSYARRRRATLTQVIVVFDGGYVPHAQQEMRNGALVVFVGYKRSADRWIMDYCERNKHHELMVVSNDREIIKYVGRRNAQTIRVEEFQRLMDEALVDVDIPQGSAQEGREAPRKLKDDRVYQDEAFFDGVDDQDVDRLMEQASEHVPEKGEEESGASRRGNPAKPSKKERLAAKKRKKL